MHGSLLQQLSAEPASFFRISELLTSPTKSSCTKYRDMQATCTIQVHAFPSTRFQESSASQNHFRGSRCGCLCGRGVPSKYHAGNHYFQYLIDSYQSRYIAARRSDKPMIAFYIVDCVVQECGGRFLKRAQKQSKDSGVKSLGGWEDIGRQRAYEKVCQALREGAPDLRRKMAAKEMAAAALGFKMDDYVTKSSRNKNKSDSIRGRTDSIREEQVAVRSRSSAHGRESTKIFI